MEVKIYSGYEPYSDMVKNLLRSNNIEFTNIDVSRSKERQKELKEISGQTATPVIVIDGKAFVGFDRELIKKVLNLKEKK